MSEVTQSKTEQVCSTRAGLAGTVGAPVARLLPGVCGWLSFFVLLPLFACDAAPEPATALVRVEAAAPLGEISPYLTGMNLLHHFETDEVLADGRLAGYLRDIRAGILRYPGGEVAGYYHWEQPGWPGWKDAWETDPAKAAYLAPEQAARNTNFMNTDKYIAWCRKVGAEPMIGVDIESGYLHHRIQDSLNEAVRWVRYCKDKQYHVKYWFMDNESYAVRSYAHLSAEQYANYVKLFGTAMKKADPDIKLAANWQCHFASPQGLADWQTILNIAGDVVDIADVHAYWAHGRANWDLWLRENPIRPHYPGTRSTSYTDELNRFHALIKSMGLHTQIGVFEWNVGPNKQGPLPSPFQCALIDSELLFQLTQGGAVICCFWPFHWPSPSATSRTHRFFLAPDTLQPNPVYEVFKLFSQSLGQTLVPSRSTEKRLLALSSLSRDTRTLRLYLLRKSNPGPGLRTTLQLEGFVPTGAKAVCFAAPDFQTEPKLTDLKVNGSGGSWQLTAPACSFTLVTFTR